MAEGVWRQAGGCVDDKRTTNEGDSEGDSVPAAVRQEVPLGFSFPTRGTGRGCVCVCMHV